MFSPEMMAAAQQMAAKLTPEQMAEMQRSMTPEMMQQAMGQMSSMSPAEMQRIQQMASSLPPETLAAAAAAQGAAPGSAAAGGLSAQQEYQYSASMQLKAEGNSLHSAGQYEQAAAKYERAVSNLEGHAAAKSDALRLSCQSNLASCALARRQWDACAVLCTTVLASDPGNRKALYRRGVAGSELGRHDAAVADLRRALELSPAGDRDAVAGKLEAALQRQAHAQRGVVVEEVDSAEEDEAESGAAEAVAAEGKAAEPASAARPEAKPEPEPAPAPAPVPVPAARPGPSGTVDPQQQAQQMAEILQSNPDAMRQAAEAMQRMSDSEVAAHLAASGGLAAGMTPEMAKSAAAMMRGLPPAQLEAMVKQAAAAAPSASFPSARPAAAAPAGLPAGVPPVPADMMAQLRRDPGMLKSAAQMLESLPEEQLQAMMGSMPGAPPGTKMDVSQLRMAAKMMESMSPDDLERMAALGQASSAPGTGAPSLAGTGGGALAADGGLGGGGLGGGLAGMSPEMMASLRKQAADPAMVKAMRGMMKDMDPEALAGMMRQSGMDVTPEQAKRMADQMGQMSDSQLEWMTKVAAWMGMAAEAVQRVRRWARSHSALVVALVVLLLAVLLRWLGWV